MKDIVIRKPRKDEAREIAGLLMLAWPVEEILESNSITYDQLLEVITSICSLPDSIYSYENTFIAEVDGRTVGAMCGYDGADYQRLKQPIVEKLGTDSGFAELVETEAGEFYLDSVGVAPEFRGRGIATRLFEAQIKRGVSLGHSRIGLIVDVDKPEAEALYRKLGFTHVGERDFFGHQMKHMVKIISA